MFLRSDSPIWVQDYYNSREFLTSHLHWSTPSNYAADHGGRDAWRRYSNRLKREVAAMSPAQVESTIGIYRR